MGFVRRGGGGGDEDDATGDEAEGLALRRCEECRRELLPWQDTCPDDGGRAVAPQEIEPDHDALLARLLAEDGDEDRDEAPDDDVQWPRQTDDPADPDAT